jgi:hypothetical protein
MTTGPVDPAKRAEWRRARRQVARRLHPDLGGDPDEYLAALAGVDRAYGVHTTVPGYGRPQIRMSPVRRLSRPLVRAVRAGARGLRARLPRRVPGARRYIDL